jgi:hypothetical protein
LGLSDNLFTWLEFGISSIYDKKQVTSSVICAMMEKICQGGGMKRLLPLIPIILLMFLNSCGSINTGVISSQEWTAVWLTTTATFWTPTPPATLDPEENKIVEWLNEELLKTDPLEQTLDAKYQVLDASFPVAQGNSFPNFRIDLRCECTYASNCCTPERMFVVLIKAMVAPSDSIMDNVPDNVSDMKIVCYDHSVQINVIGARWSDVTSYLKRDINGYQLGSRVFHTTIP